MATPIPTKTKLAQQIQIANFTGFDDWVELFRAGEQTDSAGNTRTWTHDDLDQMIRNHTAETAAPIVLGHPKHDARAFGWTHELKRDGDLLLGKFEEVDNDFKEAVRAKHYRRRSISLGHDPESGFYLRHVGWLGAAAPAVKGLADVQFSEKSDTTIYEFSYEDAAELSRMARLFRGIQTLLAEKFGSDATQVAIPDWEIDSLNRQAGREEAQADAESDTNTPIFTETPPTEDTTVPQSQSFTQADIDAAVAQARADEQTKANQFQEQVQQLEQEKRQASAEAAVNQLMDEGKVLPSQATGLAEFVAALDGPKESASFEFSADDGTKKTDLKDWFLNNFMANQPKVSPVGPRSESGDPIGADDYNAIRRKAVEFQDAERAAGRTCTFTDAWEHAKKGAQA